MVMTGHSNRDLQITSYPSFGSVVSRVRGQSTVPPFVSLRGMSRGTEPGYLGIAHRPFTPGGPGLANLTMASGVDANRLNARQTLLNTFDSLHNEIDSSGTMEGMDSFQSTAFDIVSSGGVRNALDLNLEPQSVRNRYTGNDQQNFLRALRLVEAGVGCVTLGIGGWDTHSNNFRSLATKLPQLDRGIAHMIEDLHQRGLGNDVITIVWGEFGRTPRINRNAGRDHWPSAMSALIAGGGLRMGQMVGSTNARAERPQDTPCTPSNVLATIYTAMGINPAATFDDNTGRPRYILDNRMTLDQLL
jgi:hypothetical protein